MSRDAHLAAPGWRPVAPGAWHRDAVSARSPSALVRCVAGRYEMRIGGGAWQPAGETLLDATKHAGGHAARLELMAARGGDDLCGACATCARIAAAASGDVGR